MSSLSRLAVSVLGFLIVFMPAEPACAQVPDKPPANDNMFESTQPPATAEESAALLAELEEHVDVEGPALFAGGYLVDRRGMSVYVFDRDRPNVSTCYRACEKLWPPLLAGLDDQPVGDFDIIERLYGARQWTWRGKPLYHWPSDTKPGDRTGDNVSGVWHLVLESAAAAEPPPKPRRRPPPAQSEYEY